MLLTWASLVQFDVYYSQIKLTEPNPAHQTFTYLQILKILFEVNVLAKDLQSVTSFCFHDPSINIISKNFIMDIMLYYTLAFSHNMRSQETYYI